jgi:hypothetical protein
MRVIQASIDHRCKDISTSRLPQGVYIKERLPFGANPIKLQPRNNVTSHQPGESS